MNLKEAIQKESSKKLTENQAVAYNTTNSALLDLFGTIGALRPRSDRDIEDKFAAAFNEDGELATRMMFYCGNIRGGLGERRTFQICLRWLAFNYPKVVKLNLGIIPHYNRWDSLSVLIGTPVEAEMWQMVREQLDEDIDNYKKGEPVSLLAKWLPSENASSKKTKQLARKATVHIYGFGKERKYRKTLSALRKHLNIVERSMSAQEWDEIIYSHVPSYAMKRYGSAFASHDYERFNKYLEDLKEGREKVNASALFPYDLVKPIVNEEHLGYPFSFYERERDAIDYSQDIIREAQWQALPDYVEEGSSILVMADVSGSMSMPDNRPMSTSIGLAIYFAERNKGPLEGCYMTFTDQPHFISINENQTLRGKVQQVLNTDIGYSTNLEKAFDYLLTFASYYKISPEDMPKALCVISDMEIDEYMRDSRKLDFVEIMKLRYESLGYNFPKLVLWNVEARQNTFLSQNENVLFVSGQSPSVFNSLISSIDGTSWELLIDTLNCPIYNYVKFPSSL